MLNPTIPVQLTPSLIAHIDSEPTVRTMRAIREASAGESPDGVAITLCAHVVRGFEGTDAPDWPALGNPQALPIREGILLDMPIRLLNLIADAASARLKPPEDAPGK